jgi:hypothetical protein
LQKQYIRVLPFEMLDADIFFNTSSIGLTILGEERIMIPSTPFDNIEPMKNNTRDLTGPVYDQCPDFDCCKFYKDIIQNYFAYVPPNIIYDTLIHRLGFPFTTIGGFQNIKGSRTPIYTPNIYIQVNPEQGFGNMDVGGNEYIKGSHESTGQVKYVIGKVLLNPDVGPQSSQTIIQNPVRFDPPLGKLERLTFRFLLEDLTPIDRILPINFDFMEWDGVVQIDENIGTLDRGSDLSQIPSVEWAAEKRPF